MLRSSDLWCGEWFTAKARVFKPEQKNQRRSSGAECFCDDRTVPPTHRKRFAQGAVQEDVFSRRLIIY